MVTRRDVVTGGALSALTAAAFAEPAPAEQDDGQTASAVRGLRGSLDSINSTLNTAFETNAVAFGYVPKIREMFTTFMRANFKFPDYMEIGMDVFYDLYDWHIKHNRQMEVSRVLDNRMAIRFMFTLMVLRPEQDPKYLGIPYDRA